MGFFDNNFLGKGIRNIGSTVTFGAIDSSSTVQSKGRDRRQNRAMQGLEEVNTKQDKAIDDIQKAAEKSQKEIAKNQAAMQSDIDVIEKKNASQDEKIGTAFTAIGNLRKDSEKAERMLQGSIAAVQRGIDTENLETSRLVGDLQKIVAQVPGGQSIMPILDRINRDGRVDHSELAELVSAGLQFTFKGFKKTSGELAATNGDIEVINGRLAAHEQRMRGISSNARQIAANARKLADLGITSVGDMKGDLANGALFFKGRRYDVQAFILSLVATRAMRVYTISKDKENGQGMKNLFAMDKDSPAQLCDANKTRIASASDGSNLVSKDDHHGLSIEGGKLTLTLAKDAPGGKWSDGTIVYQCGEARIASTMPSMAKVILAATAMSFDKWYAMVAPLFTETITNKLGFEDGFDFGKND